MPSIKISQLPVIDNANTSQGVIPIVDTVLGITSKVDVASLLSSNSVSSTDNAIVRFDGTAGTIQNSGVVIDDTNNVSTAGTLQGSQLKSTIVTGTAPLTVASTTLVTNLNADLLDGNQASAFAASAHTHGDITSTGTISTTAITPVNGDYLLISDTSNSSKIQRGAAIGSSTTTYLRNDGSWATPPDTNTVYTHPTSDGSLHVPATSTTNNGKVLTAGASAGSFAWNTLDLTYLPDAAFKKSCVVATTANIGSSFAAGVITGPVGVLVIDGITVALNDRILVKDQTAQLQNGIYYVSTLGTAGIAWVLTRTPGANSASEIAGAMVNVDKGTSAGLMFDTDFKATDTLDTTALTWNRVVDTGLASATTPVVAGTATIGTSINYARADHIHPAQTTITGNAATASTLQTTRTINTVNFNGSSNIVVEPYIEQDLSTNAARYICFVDTSVAGHQRLNLDTSLAFNPSTDTLSVGNLVSTGNLGLGVPTSVWSADTRAVEANGNAFCSDGASARLTNNAYKDIGGVWLYKSAGYACNYNMNLVGGTHVWQTAVSGLSDNPITWVNAMSLDNNGNLTTIGSVQGTSFNSITGLASAVPVIAGTAAVGSSTTVARQDHVHPAQTTITGNAATATKLAATKTISGVAFDGSANINIEDRLGTPIASAATTTIGTAGLGDYIHITGTTTITSFGTASTTGIRRTLIFDGALTLTHNATSLICMGGSNITTVAGTVIEVVAETTANWRVVSITHPSISMAELGYLDGVTSSIQTQLGAKLSNSGGTMTGAITAIRETKVNMAANDINLAAGNMFCKTVATTVTLTVSNILTTGNANSFILELTNGGAYAITWWSGIKWAGGTVPTLTASGVDILGFYSHDGGTVWRGVVLAKDSK